MKKLAKFSNLSACVATCMHIFCCGIPILAAVLDIAAPFASFLPHDAKYILLAFAFVATAVSWAVHFRGCKCNRTLLFISTALFVVAIFITFATPYMGIGGCR